MINMNYIMIISLLLFLNYDNIVSYIDYHHK